MPPHLSHCRKCLTPPPRPLQDKSESSGCFYFWPKMWRNTSLCLADRWYLAASPNSPTICRLNTPHGEGGKIVSLSIYCSDWASNRQQESEVVRNYRNLWVLVMSQMLEIRSREHRLKRNGIEWSENCLLCIAIIYLKSYHAKLRDVIWMNNNKIKIMRHLLMYVV